MDFDYKKYSLGQLETWVSDALLSSEATPQEIYDVIRGAVNEEYHYFKHHTGRCYELLALLGGTNNLQEQVKAHGEFWDKEDKITSCDKDDKSPECQKSWNDFWEENYYPEEYYKNVQPSATQRDIDQYSEEELNAMCDKAASDQEKEKCREYNLREAEYYNKRAELDLNPGPKQEYLGWKDVSSEEFDNIFPKKEKVVKWQLPIEIDGASGEYYIQFPDDLMEAAGIKENDLVQWIDQGDGSYLLKKVEKRTEKVSPDNMTWDQAIAGGWVMTDDGFWIKK